MQIDRVAQWSRVFGFSVGVIATAVLLLTASSAQAIPTKLAVTPTDTNAFGVPYRFDYVAAGTAEHVDCGIPTFPMSCWDDVVVRAVQAPATCDFNQGYLILATIGSLPAGDFNERINQWAGHEGPNRFCLIVSRALAGGRVTVSTDFVDVPDAVGPPPRDVVNCESFTNRSAAVTYFLYYPGDPGNLDGDNDGRPCTSENRWSSTNPPGLWQRFIPVPVVVPVVMPTPTVTPRVVPTPAPTVAPAPIATSLKALGLPETRGYARRYLAHRYSSFSARTLDQLDCYKLARLRSRCGVNWHRGRIFWGGKLTVTRSTSGLRVSNLKIRKSRT